MGFGLEPALNSLNGLNRSFGETLQSQFCAVFVFKLEVDDLLREGLIKSEIDDHVFKRCRSFFFNF